MKGVILAAGDGSRLAPLTKYCPKPLIAVGGRPLLDYTIKAFVQAGIRDLVIVVGYRGEQIQKWWGDGARYGARVAYALNPNYELGNATSLYAAQPYLDGGDFILSMADHLIAPAIVAALCAVPSGCHALGVDHQAQAPPQVNDATRVWVNGAGIITRLGKDVTPWNGIDTGVFHLTPRVFPAIVALAEVGDDGYGLSQALTRLILSGDPLWACDVSGAFWMDVDTIEDLRYAEAELQRSALPPLSAMVVGGKKLCRS